MLAQNFKTAADLGLSDIEFESLVRVLGMLERGDIEPHQFTMATTGSVDWWDDPQLECGTPACICGWARHVASQRVFRKDMRMYPAGLQSLFCMGGDSVGAPINFHSIEEASIALRNYLRVGKPGWQQGSLI